MAGPTTTATGDYMQDDTRPERAILGGILYLAAYAAICAAGIYIPGFAALTGLIVLLAMLSESQ